MQKKIWLILMILFYLGAGINHFLHAEFYLEIMPSWVPFPAWMVQISGGVEILLALLLIFPTTQSASAWTISVMLIIFFICIHIPMALDFDGWNDWLWWIAVARLPVQYFLFRWAHRYTKGNTVYFWGKPDRQ